jgi:hypothetical protein
LGFALIDLEYQLSGDNNTEVQKLESGLIGLLA